MATLANAVYDAALNYIKSNVDQVKLLTSGSSVVLSVSSGISSGDFSGPGDGSTGRKLSCLTSSAIASQAVSAAGAINKLQLLTGASVVVVQASISGSDVSVGASDTVTVGSFKVELADPT